VMKFGYELIKPLREALLRFMEKHNFETLEDFRGHGLDYFTSHAELVRLQADRKATQKAAADRERVIKADSDWRSDKFVEQSAALSS
jgi:hypothetical protein